MKKYTLIIAMAILMGNLFVGQIHAGMLVSDFTGGDDQTTETCKEDEKGVIEEILDSIKGVLISEFAGSVDEDPCAKEEDAENETKGITVAD